MKKHWNRGKGKQTLCLMLAGLMALSAPQAALATSISNMEKEKKKAQEALNEANADAKEAQAGKNQAQSEVNSLRAELSEIIGEISLLEADIEAKDQQIQEAQKDYEAAKAKEESQKEYMEMRIQYMYERGDTEFLDVLLRVESMAELLNKSEYMEAIYTYDKKMMDEYRETKLQVQAYKQQLENDKADLEGMQVEYQEQQQGLETTIAKKRTEIANFDEQLAQAKKDAEIYAKEITKKNQQIRAAEEEARRKAEEEARRKAEEEARQKAEAEAASKAESQAAANNSGSTAPTGSGQSDTKNTTAPTKPQPTQSNQSPSSSKSSSTQNSSAPKKSSGGSAQGRAVADYGLQFVGNPYVYGGTSLTNGADCSGFVQSVYKHFGYTLPRTSTEQRSAGVGVSYSEAQPGDLICYAGHIGIYIGNGQIVHASNARTGIKVSNATYRSILAVRRIIQ